jgi:hypothetical protein
MGDDAPKRPLEYDRPAGGTVSVRGLRFLIVLTLINTLLLTWFAVVGMQGPQMIQQRWRQWQSDRQQAKAIVKLAAEQKALMNHAFAPGTVIYTEDLARAKSAGPNSRPIRVDGATVPEWQAPVHIDAPSSWNQALSNGGRNAITSPTIVLFAHERTVPDGSRRLVIVQLEARQGFKRNPGGGPDRVITSRRLIVSATREVDPKQGLVATTIEKAVELRLPPDETSVTRHPADGSYDVKRGAALTLFAGQPDSADLSHVILNYEIDGKPGTIDLWVGDRELRVKPRQGIPRFENGREAWELGVSPTTAPAAASASRP